MPEVKQAEENAYMLMGDVNQLDLEEALTTVGTASEMQGWIYGFQYAMRLITSCRMEGGKP